MKLHIDTRRITGRRDPMIYGHFIEHFHRQIYGGVYDPQSPLADEDGLRTDVLEAMRRIRVPVLRWPGGCFVSAHHWKDAVGAHRTPSFDKAWRVEEPNLFGTDEFIALCRKVGCAPYICTNAGTGTAEEMSDWVEYCNLEQQGKYAKWRVENGHPAPHAVPYWSIGNENYGGWEIGAKSAGEWARLVLEAAKMMRRVDPTIQLSAAALADLDWNIQLLRLCGDRLHWISLHEYWDGIQQTNHYATYEQVMAMTDSLDGQLNRVRGLLAAMGLTGRIRVAFDEWNLRGWYHPLTHTVEQGLTPEEYLTPRDLNDDNTRYTMADAVFSACFLNMCLRNCDLVGMANFAPIVNTRGCIYTHDEGVVLRSTYHVFNLYVNRLGEEVLDTFTEQEERLTVHNKAGEEIQTSCIDIIATLAPNANGVTLAAVNKHPAEAKHLTPEWTGPFIPTTCAQTTLSGEGPDAYNGVGHIGVLPQENPPTPYTPGDAILLPPHSVSLLHFS